MAAMSAGREPRRIFEPDNVEELLRGWLLHAHKGRRRHDLSARRCTTLRLWIGGIAASVSAIVGTSVFVALEKETSKTSNIPFAVMIASLAILSAVLTSLTTFLNLSERAEKHRSAGVEYKKVIREVERILSVPVGNLANSDPSVVALEKRLDDIEDGAPVVPERIYDRVEAEWDKRGVEMVPKADDLYKK
jgi:hypothetical protein